MSLLSGFENIVRENEPLPMHTWLQVGGTAKYFAEPETPEQLIELIRRCHEQNMPVKMLGHGSNVLVRDGGVGAMVIHLFAPAFCGIKIEGNSVVAGGGAMLARVVTSTVHKGLGGLEMLIGIPGTVGGAIHGNADTRGGSIGQWTIQTTVISITGEVFQRQADELEFGYQQSNQDDLVVLEAACQLDPENPQELAKRMQKSWIVKRASQPMGHQCTACIFKDPRGASAGELIDTAGLKGMRIGGAAVSERHANFFIAEPECTSEDVLRLIDLVREQVQERMEVELELALEIW